MIIFLDQQLGRSTFGAVFKSSYRGQICAVTILLQDDIEMQLDIPMGKASKAFDRECVLLESLQHTNII